MIKFTLGFIDTDLVLQFCVRIFSCQQTVSEITLMVFFLGQMLGTKKRIADLLLDCMHMFLCITILKFKPKKVAQRVKDLALSLLWLGLLLWHGLDPRPRELLHAAE